MPPPLRPATLRLEVFGHETEDQSRVKRTLFSPPEDVDETVVTGGYGNRIFIHGVVFKEKKAASFFEKVVDSLTPDDRSAVLSELEDHVDDEGEFCIKLDKQEAYNGRIKFLPSGSNVVSLTLKFANFKRDKRPVVDYIREAIEKREAR